MSSRSERRLLVPIVLLLSTTLLATAERQAMAAEPPMLRVCSDPNNLPFSNSRGEGFENRIAELVAHDLGMKVSYLWWPQRRGFIRKTLNAGQCDVLIGVPANLDMVATTRPYYRSTYVFVTRRDRKLEVSSFDDPRLRKLKIGVPMIGNEYANSPPAHALSNRGIIGNVAGYMVYGDSSSQHPRRGLVEAVALREVDIGAVWGPIAGYYIRRSRVPLKAVAVTPEIDLPFLPFVFDIAMAVRRGDPLKERLDGVIERRRAEIDAILREYGVPRVDVPLTSAMPARSAEVRP
jgi:mxaJ protein